MRFSSFAGMSALACLTSFGSFPQLSSAAPATRASPEAIKVSAPNSGIKHGGALTYEVTVKGELGMETQLLSVPAGTPPRIVDIGQGLLEIAPARSAAEPSAISFYLSKTAAPILTHSTRIVASAEKPVQVLYLVCGSAVTYYSPRPAQLPKCNSTALAARQP
ncbi:MAG: hypothetical protein K0R43_3036 [Pseudoduganella sp.]|jgi:hypothetical protein|nr:hypothetical protein [Pseudoduganella sp.]